ncbi:hypothetical protein ACVQ92_09770 [Staphylococcus aureus]
MKIIPASPLLRPAFIAPRLTASPTALAGTSIILAMVSILLQYLNTLYQK